VILATTLPMLVVVNNSVPAKTLGEFNAYAKTQAGKVTYASNGAGTPPHLGAELYARAAGFQMTHVPYRGGAPALTDLAGGQTSVMFAVLPDALPLVKDGRIRALAVTTVQRSALVPDLPTVTEATVPGFELNAWYAFLAPTGTPKPVLARLNKALDEALQDQGVRERLHAMGYIVEGGAPERLSDLMRSESKKWGDVIRAANIKAD
jgi:tripartite-type tricarboxylate transporter receptor subunit TctC